jgi:hypothetical protein
MGLVTVVRSNLCTCNSEETFLVIGTLRILQLIFVDGLQDLVISPEVGLGNEQSILQIYLVIFIVAFIGKLNKTKGRDVARFVTCIL